MALLKVLGIFVFATCSVTGQGSDSFAQPKPRYYRIQNAGDKTYLGVYSGGIKCKRIGSVVTSSSVPSSDKSNYLWISTDIPSDPTLSVKDVTGKNGERFAWNEVSFEGADRNCKFSPLDLSLHQLRPNIYVIMLGSDKCLTSSGSGERISWKRCDTKNRQQVWVFHQVAL